MRGTSDRIRHALLFELIALVIVAPLGAVVFDMAAAEFGMVAIVSATLALGWNYVYNLGFDHLMLRTGRDLRKTPRIRIVHALLFEATLTALLVPFIVWQLQVTLGEALMMDLTLAGFYALYALAFNWIYDVIFPVPMPQESGLD